VKVTTHQPVQFQKPCVVVLMGLELITMTEIWEVVRLPALAKREEFERYYAIREKDRRDLYQRMTVLLRARQKNYGKTGGYV
jgi:hypothetical protein